MKTPEEIKKGLECCRPIWKNDHFKTCDSACPYVNEGHFCRTMLNSDAVALIRKLEAQNAELLGKIKQLERERDAAIYDLKKTRECTTCEYVKKSPSELPCVSCGIILKNYEWRGPCEENGGAV